MERVLVTGCSGLVGVHLIKKLLESNKYSVIGTDIRINDEIIKILDSVNFKFIQKDLTESNSIEEIFNKIKPDIVLNTFDVKGSPLKAMKNPVDFLYPSFKINTEIINQSYLNNCWLVFVSSVGVYHPAEKFIEDDVWTTLPSQSDWFPSWSKRMGEILLESYKIQYKYDKWSIIRPANIFGEYDDFSGTGTVISSIIKKISDAPFGGKIEAWGDGSPIRDFVYAGDVADSIIKLFEDKIHCITNFGSGIEVSIKEIIENLLVIGNKNQSVVWDTRKPNGDSRRLMDITRQKSYGLISNTPLVQALERTYNYYITK